MAIESDQIATRKLLVAFDTRHPKRSSSDFLVPLREGGGRAPFLFGLKSKGLVRLGMVVFVGRSVSMSDLFAKLVDCGQRIESVAGTTRDLEAYIQQLRDLKIGRIVQIENADVTAYGQLILRPVSGSAADIRDAPSE